ncbi:YraN family protein [Opitutus sp. ER46]|uniref:YraN family protein n=1 Tax=Opitutus sp. ER46 TaxID=2161864 RepID=UPI000D3098F4|nr:YraN family protein [Opitutus sp. ER46]PTX91317.1 endonuclease [Opitutus sp. ER46]
MLRELWQRLRQWLARPNTGAWAERLAADWLQRERGFAIVARNWRNPRDRREELDLVCRDGDVLVFVEVKARSERARVSGYYAVNARKKRVLARAAKSYLRRLRPAPPFFRFDVVEVTIPVPAADGTRGEPEIRHFDRVPLFGKDYRWW